MMTWIKYPLADIFPNATAIDPKNLPGLSDFDGIEEIYNVISQNGGYIAGSFASYMAGAKFEPNDIDIFTTTEEGAKIICTRLAELGMVCDIKESFYSSWLPMDDMSISQMKIQVINPIDGITTPEQIIDRFDFNVCKAILISPTEVLGDPTLLGNVGIISGVNGFVRTVERIAKYTARGITFPPSEIRKLFLSWSKLSAEVEEKILLKWEGEGLDLNIGQEDSFEREHGYF